MAAVIEGVADEVDAEGAHGTPRTASTAEAVHRPQATPPGGARFGSTPSGDRREPQ